MFDTISYHHAGLIVADSQAIQQSTSSILTCHVYHVLSTPATFDLSASEDGLSLGRGSRVVIRRGETIEILATATKPFKHKKNNTWILVIRIIRIK